MYYSVPEECSFPLSFFIFRFLLAHSEKPITYISENDSVFSSAEFFRGPYRIYNDSRSGRRAAYVLFEIWGIAFHIAKKDGEIAASDTFILASAIGSFASGGFYRM